MSMPINENNNQKKKKKQIYLEGMQVYLVFGMLESIDGQIDWTSKLVAGEAGCRRLPSFCQLCQKFIFIA